MEEDNNSQLTTSSEPTTMLTAVWCGHSLSQEEGECQCWCTVQGFTLSSTEKLWRQRRHHPSPNAYYRNSSRFYKHCKIQTSNSREHNIWPTDANSNEWLAGSRKDCHLQLLDYWTYREEIIPGNDLLFKGDRLIIPEKLHNRTLQITHEGHFGVEKMQLRPREAVFWTKITADILQTAQSCKECQTFPRS